LLLRDERGGNVVGISRTAQSNSPRVGTEILRKGWRKEKGY
jgi:hypothetical protein